MKYFLLFFLPFFSDLALAKTAPTLPLLNIVFPRFYGVKYCKIISPNQLVKKIEKGYRNKEQWEELQILFQSNREKMEGFALNIIKSLNDQNKENFKKLFHPRLKMNQKDISALFAKIRVHYGKHLDFSLYRLWAINTVNGNPDLVYCFQDNLALGPHTGYTVQYGLWVTIKGKNKLGRLYISIIPHGKSWVLGAWHVQQWTHSGKDPVAWINEALGDKEKGYSESGYIKIDLAIKLLNGGDFVFYNNRNYLLTSRNDMIGGKAWTQVLQEKLTGYDVVSGETIFARDGAGILVRLKVDSNSKSRELKETCLDLAKKIARAIMVFITSLNFSDNCSHNTVILYRTPKHIK